MLVIYPGDCIMREVLTRNAKQLRQNSTIVERKLWHFLRAKQFEHCKFRRQEPVGGYIVDFISYERKVVIELDGGQHALNHVEDQTRDQWLKSQGFNVLRFWNNEVISNPMGVLAAIREGCKNA